MPFSLKEDICVETILNEFVNLAWFIAVAMSFNALQFEMFFSLSYHEIQEWMSECAAICVTRVYHAIASKMVCKYVP